MIVLIPLVELVDESISGGGGKLGQAPCWHRISTVGILYAYPSPVPSVSLSLQNTKKVLNYCPLQCMLFSFNYT